MKKKANQLKFFVLSIGDKGFFHLFGANFFINFIGFGSQFMVAWLLTPKQLGEIKIMQTYLAIAMLFATFGFSTSTLKLCSENRPDGEKVFLLNKALKYTCISIILALPVLILLIKLGFVSNDSEIIKYFPYFALAMIPMTFSNLFSSYLQAIKQFKAVSKIQSYTKVISVIAVIGLTYFMNFNGYIMAIVLGNILTYVFIFKKSSTINVAIPEIKISNPLKVHFRYSNISFITNLVTQVGMYSDVFLMNYFISNKTSIGYYSFALTLLLVANIFTNTVQQISVPNLSEKSSDKSGFNAVVKKYGKINTLVSIAIAVGLIIVMPFLIKIVFGGKFDQSIPFFIVLTFAWLFQNIASFKGYTLWGAGKIEYNLVTYIIILVLGFIISYLMMLKYGIIGLAYGKLITNFISIFIVNLIFKIGMKEYRN